MKRSTALVRQRPSAPLQPAQRAPIDPIAQAHAHLAQHQVEMRGALSAATERALRADSAIFTEWCAAAGRRSLPAEPATLAAFIDAMAGTRKPATIRRYVASIAHMHRGAKVDDPCATNIVRAAVKRMSKAAGVSQTQAGGLTRRLVDKILNAAGLKLKDLRNRALLAVAYDTLARRSELVALRLEDLHVSPDGHGSILIRRSKTDQLGEGSTRYLAPDTIRIVQEWVAGALLANGELFRATLKAGRIGGALSPYDVTRIFKSMAVAAGLPAKTVETISAHSTRVGAAQDMAASDRIELPAIMQAGGWKSATMVARYTAKQSARRSGAAKLAELQNRIP